jgi:antitoxin component of MazEF toxin-antitoxin module
MFIDMKAIYALQPYQVGSKDRKSLALIIPAKVAKRYNVDVSTVFTLQVDEAKKRILLQTLNEIITNNHHDTISKKSTSTTAAAVGDGLSKQ